MKPLDDEILKQLSAMALEKAFAICAEKALWMAENLPEGVSGREALVAYANAVSSTNAKTWPSMGTV